MHHQSVSNSTLSWPVHMLAMMMVQLLNQGIVTYGYREQQQQVDTRHHLANNESCATGVCGRSMEYHISVDDARRLSNANSVTDVLEIFGINAGDLDEAPLVSESTYGISRRTHPLSSTSRFGGPAGPARKQQYPSAMAAPSSGGFGRKSDIDFAANAGCQPERVTVPIKVPEDALESRHYHIVPTCTRIERCGGCCNHDLLSCQPMAKEIVTMNILAIPMVASLNPRPLKIPVQVEKHTNCSCDCITKPSDCSPYHVHRDCRCVCKNTEDEQICAADPRRIWDPKTCHCACKFTRPCATGHYFDPLSCKCEQLTLDSDDNVVYPSYRNRRPMLTTPNPNAERGANGNYGGGLSDSGVTSSPAISTTSRRAGRFWAQETEELEASTTQADSSTTTTSTTTTTTTPPPITTSRYSPYNHRRYYSPTTTSTTPASRSNFDDDRSFDLRPSGSRTNQYRPTTTTTDVDSAGVHPRHRQQSHFSVPSLKAWKFATANGGSSTSNNGGATSASTAGNSLDTTAFDDGDDDAVLSTRSNFGFGEDDFGGQGASDGGSSSSSTRTRGGRFHDPSEKDRIRNNISAFKKGVVKRLD